MRWCGAGAVDAAAALKSNINHPESVENSPFDERGRDREAEQSRAEVKNDSFAAAVAIAC